MIDVETSSKGYRERGITTRRVAGSRLVRCSQLQQILYHAWVKVHPRSTLQCCYDPDRDQLTRSTQSNEACRGSRSGGSGIRSDFSQPSQVVPSHKDRSFSFFCRRHNCCLAFNNTPADHDERSSHQFNPTIYQFAHHNLRMT